MSRRPLLVAAAAAVLLAGGWLGWRTLSARAIVAAHLPDQPDLRSWPAELEDRVTEAGQKARSYLRPAAGLAGLSRLYHANGFYHEALSCYAGLQQLEPRNARWPHLQASILAEFGRLEEALPLEERTVALEPAYLPAQLRLGDIRLKVNRTVPAAQAYATALVREPGNPYALLGLARCALIGNEWTNAREHLQQAVKLHPDFIGGLSLLVTVSEHFGDKDTADSLRATIGRREFSDLSDPWLDNLSDVCFDAYRLSVTAAITNFAGDQATAQKLLERAIELNPKNGSFRRQLGQMLFNLGDHASARQHLERAVEVTPLDSDSWLLLIKILNAMSLPQAAQQALVSGLAHCPKSPSLHHEYGRALKAMGRIDEAVIEFRTSFQLRPSDASPLVELAGIYFATQRTEEALAALNEALARQPDHPMALATLTFYAISTNDEAGARARWEQVRRQKRTPPEVVHGLRQAFQQQFGRPLP